jgi:hypothetical protein
VSPPVPLVIDDIDLVARLENLHCRFNLNSLGRADDPPVAAFADLVARAGSEVNIAAWQGEQLAAGGARLDGPRDRRPRLPPAHATRTQRQPTRFCSPPS